MHYSYCFLWFLWLDIEWQKSSSLAINQREIVILGGMSDPYDDTDGKMYRDIILFDAFEGNIEYFDEVTS